MGGGFSGGWSPVEVTSSNQVVLQAPRFLDQPDLRWVEVPPVKSGSPTGLAVVKMAGGVLKFPPSNQVVLQGMAGHE